MSAQGLQHVVCRGAVDRDFITHLRQTPHDAMVGFDLDEGERSLLASLAPRSLYDLAGAVEAWRRGEVSQEHVAVFAPALVARAG